MMTRRVLILIVCLSLAACRPGLPAADLQTATRSPGAARSGATLTPFPPGLPTASSTPTLWAPVKPSPVLPTPAFPTCEPEDLPVYQDDPGLDLASPVALSTPPAWMSPSASSLRALAEARQMYIGSASDPGYMRIPQHAELLAGQFNLVAVENAMKWEVIHPQADRYDFSIGDATVNFARANDMAFYGHTLVWDLQQPAWLTEGQHTREEWIQILCKHIKTVVHHYRGQMYAWVVVNEALQDDGALRDTFWLRAIGPEHIPMAFQWAHEADPEALLIYNENAGEGMNKKSQAVYSLVQGLVQTGVPIDGVGLQMHVFLDKSPVQSELAENMRRLEALGLYAHITEMDVRTHFSTASQAGKAAAQAETYRQALAACLQASNCNVFAVWGLSDNVSWIPGFFGYPDAPTLFDDAGQPKPAYYAIYDLLARP
jgi:endo-1,4-beta-xylanase